MSILSTSKLLSPCESSIIKTLIYFDCFHYPLTGGELLSFMQIKVEDEVTFLSELNSLCDYQLVFKLEGYYSIKNDSSIVARRLTGNKLAKAFLLKAYKNAKLIGSFPYVRGVGISGSLSKGYMDESGDIDFFIVTEPERLWIARTLLILYKKIFLLNNRKFFCVNYFIDTNHLEIPDKNIFTATEILTLIPAFNHEVFKKFNEENIWVRQFLPNKLPVQTLSEGNSRLGLKPGIEMLLNNGVGSYLDSVFMKLTLNKWKRKFKHIKESDFEIALRTRKYVSKHHPQGFQQRVLEAIEQKSKAFELDHNLKLS
jgi:hypothetical protein